MAEPSLENGYIKIANEIYDAFARTRIPGEARQVLDFIIRKTYGFNKRSDRISLLQFCEATGLSKPGVCKAINKLLEMNLIITQKGNGSLPKKEMVATEYGINKDFDVWNPLPKKITLPKKEKIVTQKGNNSLPKKRPSKDNITKDISKDSTPYPQIIETYHLNCTSLPNVRKITEAMKTTMKRQWDGEQASLQWWEDYFKTVSRSDFLTGRKTEWKANFVWLIKPENMAKVLNGQYDNHSPTNVYIEAARDGPGKALKRIHDMFQEVKEEERCKGAITQNSAS